MDNEEFKKKETVEKENPGFNGNFDTLIPTAEESRQAAEKCKSAYKALMEARGYRVGGDEDVKEKEQSSNV